MSIDRAALLKNLHLYGMAAAWSEWQAEYAIQQKPVMPEVWLDRLIKAEQVDRQARRLLGRHRADGGVLLLLCCRVQSGSSDAQ